MVELLKVTVVSPAICDRIVTSADAPFTFNGPDCVPPRLVVPLFTLIVLERFEPPLVSNVPPFTVTTPVTFPFVRLAVPLSTVRLVRLPPIWFRFPTDRDVKPVTEPPLTVVVPLVTFRVVIEPAETFSVALLLAVPATPPATTFAVPVPLTSKDVRVAAEIRVPPVTVADVAEPAVTLARPARTAIEPPETVTFDSVPAVRRVPLEVVFATVPAVILAVPGELRSREVRSAAEIRVPPVTVAAVAEPAVTLVKPARTATEPPETVTFDSVPAVSKVPLEVVFATVPAVILAVPGELKAREVRSAAEFRVPLVTMADVAEPDVTLAVPPCTVIEPPETVTFDSVPAVRRVPLEVVFATVPAVILAVPGELKFREVRSAAEFRVPPVTVADVAEPAVTLARPARTAIDPPETVTFDSVPAVRRVPLEVVFATVPAVILAVPGLVTFRVGRLIALIRFPSVTETVPALPAVRLAKAPAAVTFRAFRLPAEFRVPVPETVDVPETAPLD